VRWLASSAALVGLVAMAGCSSWGQVQLPTEVRVPVPVPCLDALPPSPKVANDEQLLALGDYDLVVTLAKDRKALEAAYLELRAAAGACLR